MLDCTVCLSLATAPLFPYEQKGHYRLCLFEEYEEHELCATSSVVVHDDQGDVGHLRCQPNINLARELMITR